ncbi:L,D-transpeptidase family protein [Streptomyces sp. NPDC004609]|uniref:L,D-transpeptidase family protein n=1 Tax=Streptomyces sp. NPDC004609 TaxID=3364704 RepID=UPI0036C1CCE5
MKRMVPVLALAVGLLLTGCQAGGSGSGAAGRGPGSAPTPALGGAGQHKASPTSSGPAEIPGLGPLTRARIGAGTRQVFVVTGASMDSNHSTGTLYERDPVLGWKPAADPWPARNAHRGWTRHHRQGDLRSPIGVFGLTDAGGRLADPGTELPYDRGPAFRTGGTNFEGEPKRGAFDYVVAVNYNRKPGTTPLDWTRPLGTSRGGGIWIHVGHGGGTEGCVGLARERMKDLLRRLDPSARPVVAMGPAEELAR